MFKSIFGTDMPLAIQFCLAFLVVLGLIGAIAWAAGRFGKGRLIGNIRNRQSRLSIVDSASIDARRRLVLVRRDNIEHLLMIGGPTDLVVEANIAAAVAGPHEVMVTRSPTAAQLTPPPPRAIRPLDKESRPPQPEAATIPRPAQRIEPLPEAPVAALLPSQAETSSRPQRDMLAALAAELSTHPAPPHKNPTADTRPHPTGPRRLRPEPAVGPLAEPPIGAPHPVAPAAAKARSTLDENLADMTRQLEAALRKPNAAIDAALTVEPTPAARSPAQAPAVDAETTTPSASRAPRPIEPKPRPPDDAKPNQSTTPNHGHEQELANMLGRSIKN